LKSPDSKKQIKGNESKGAYAQRRLNKSSLFWKPRAARGRKTE
jgi:hypothetical protein